MIIHWLLVIGIFIQATTCEELDIDETVLTAEEEEVCDEKFDDEKKNGFLLIFDITLATSSVCTDNPSTRRRSNH